MSAERSLEPATSVARVCRQGRRVRQEDAAAYLVHEDWVFLVVADGLGGLSNGGFAARRACEVFLQAAARVASRGGNPTKTLEDAAFLVNGLLLSEKKTRHWPDLGTTVAMALYRPGKITVAHAGDSRVYIVAADDVQLLTRDHAPAQDFVDQGVAASLSEARNLVGSGITCCLGDEEFPGLEVREVELGSGEGFLLVLTTDGAHEFLQPADFLHQATGCDSVAALVDRLAGLAWQRGSEDNITVLAAEIGAFPRSRVSAVPVWEGEASGVFRGAALLKRWLTAFLLGLLLGGLAGLASQRLGFSFKEKRPPTGEVGTLPTRPLSSSPSVSAYEDR
ncbi:MAG: PP2C family protein-serine/threonine phosphatase [Thermoanaerobaculum sp.]